MDGDDVLVLNAGSSSLKFALFRNGVVADALDAAVRGQLSGIGSQPVFSVSGDVEHGDSPVSVEHVVDHDQAIAYVLHWLDQYAVGLRLLGVGHRVVHGGPERCTPALIDDDLLVELDALASLAPHHQPHNLAAIRAVAVSDPGLPQVACFDTAFHATQSDVARCLPLPREYRDAGLQRYGFHGLSYEYIVSALPNYNGGTMPQRVVVAHLGNGASLCAVRDGGSVATTMGFSTLDGLLMGTRCGGIDPGALLHLMREYGLDEPALSDLLYNRSGLLGVSGLSADMRVLLDSSERGAAEAIDLYCHTLVRAIGAMAAELGGIDALVFTGGVGEHAAPIRQRVCERLDWLGLDLDRAANDSAEPLLSSAPSRVKVWVIPTNEELVIARHTARLVGR